MSYSLDEALVPPGAASAIIDVMIRFGWPDEPVDGDCLIYAPRVTEELVQRGVVAAHSVWVTGYARGAIVFMHKATRVACLILDGTAQQFSPKLPRRWLAEEANYKEAMVRETGVDFVEIEYVQAAEVPDTDKP